MELLAAGRMAEVFAWDEGRVVKLDRPEWNGVASMEALVLETVAAAGVRAPRSHGTVTIGDRHGVVMDRVEGPSLSEVIATTADLDALASIWTEMHGALNVPVTAALPDLVASLADGVAAGGLASASRQELLDLLDALDDGERVLCHFDLHSRRTPRRSRGGSW